MLTHFANERVRQSDAYDRVDAESRQHRGAKGFSLLELMIVLSVILIAGAIATLSIQNAARSVRLFEAGTDYANLLQNARIRSVKDDRYYTVRINPATTTVPVEAYVDLAGTGVFAAGDPVMVFPQGVTPMSFASGPSLANLEAQFLPSGANALATIDSTSPGPTFSSRGLPCTPSAGVGGTSTCSSMTPTSFIVFLQNQENGEWMAVTVTPAGRIRQWQYDNAGNWSPRN